MCSSPTEANLSIKALPVLAKGDNNDAFIHSAINEYMVIDKDSKCT